MSTNSFLSRLDYAAAWRQALQQQHADRLDPQGDRQFWSKFAPQYEQRVSVPGSYDRTLDFLTSLISPGDTLLDVGAGDGRFAVPLASVAGQVTAVDHSPEMLALLDRKSEQAGLKNVVTLEGNWPEVDVPRHDTVLTAWAMYRQLDIERSLERLIEVTGRQLVIAMSDVYDAPHRTLIRQFTGRDNDPVEPLYLYILGTLRQLGIRASLQVLWETRAFTFDTLDDAMDQIGPLDLPPDDYRSARDALGAIVSPDSQRLSYSFDVPVAIIHWERQRQLSTPSSNGLTPN